jgi:hypothetical protein
MSLNLLSLIRRLGEFFIFLVTGVGGETLFAVPNGFEEKPTFVAFFILM